jgi:hypothetical protein
MNKTIRTMPDGSEFKVSDFGIAMGVAAVMTAAFIGISIGIDKLEYLKNRKKFNQELESILN